MAARIKIREYLAGGDRRSIGRSDELVMLVERRMGLLKQLVEHMWDSDPVVAMRAADAVEKITRARQASLQPFKQELLGLADEASERELRWHLALMFPRLQLSSAERWQICGVLRNYLEDTSSLVKTFALQALFDISRPELRLRAETEEILKAAARTGTPAMRARARILLAQMAKDLRQKSGKEKGH